MHKEEFVEAVKKLGLKPNDYIVVGSGVLVALGIRTATDVDLIVSEPIFHQFEETGEWQRKDFDDGTHYLLKGKYEIGLDWDGENTTPNLKDLKKSEVVIDNIPFVSLERLRHWKAWKNTPKHLADIRLIDDYLSR